MSLNWRMNRKDKLVYMEDDKGKILGFALCFYISLLFFYPASLFGSCFLYVVAFEREGGKLGTIAKRPDEELIVKNFVLPRDEDLFVQPAAGAGQKCRREKKGMCRSSDSWCDYVVVSDSLEGLAPIVIRRPKPEPKDTTDIPPSNPNDPIDLESCPERLVWKKAEKRKQNDADADGQPAKKVQRNKITRRGYSFLLEAGKTAGGENLEADKPVDVAADAEKVTSPEIVDGASNPQTPELAAHDFEKGKTTEEISITTSPSKASGFMPENIEKVTVEDQGSFSDAGKNSPIRLYETLGDYYYYRTYSEKNASEIHVPIWNLKKGDTFLYWCVLTYHAYLEEAASYTSTTHRIVREWHNMHKEWAAFKVSKKKVVDDENRVAQLRARLEPDKAKFEADRKTEEWSVAGWKRKTEAEAALLSEERKNWKKICEKDNAEKIGLRNVINNIKAKVEKLKKHDAEIERLKKEKADAEAEQLKKDLELAHTEKTKASHRLAETEEKLENSETARATAESELEPLKSDMLWLKERGIVIVAESVLNSEELDKTVARLVIAARNDGYAQGYAECSHHVLPVMDLINVTLQSEDHVAQLKEIFPDGDEAEDLA
ncbi:hypothetical protein Hanom_Chr02g00114851 [Helianthus anomalus]